MGACVFVARDEIEIIIKIIIIAYTRMYVGLWLSTSRLIFELGSGTDGWKNVTKHQRQQTKKSLN